MATSLDVSGELAAFERFDGHRGDLAGLHVADFGFAQWNDELHRCEVAQHRKCGARGACGAGRREEPDELAEPAAERPALDEEAPAAPVALDPDPLEELVVLEALVVPLPDTVSPTWPESETIVPSSGAYSLVSWTACSSLCTVSLSLLTAALAEARLASRVAGLTVALDDDGLELVSLPSLLFVLLPGEVVVGVVVVLVLPGDVMAGVLLLVVGVIVLGVVVVLVVAGVVVARRGGDRGIARGGSRRRGGGGGHRDRLGAYRSR